MRFALPEFVRRRTRLLFAIVVAIAIAASTTFAQLGSFDSSFDGQLWGVRHELVPGTDGFAAGVLFVNGTLYVVDSNNDVVTAYDAAGSVVAKPGAQWNTTVAGSPVSGMQLHALGAAVVTVNGTDRQAILISSETDNRVAAFDTNGAHLFTLRLARPETVSPLLWLTLGQLAMSPGAKFTLNTATQTLALNGTFAAAWQEQLQEGSVDSGALVFPSSTVFTRNGGEFAATPDRILRGNENQPAAPDPLRFFGVTFDNAGNLYALDAFTERLHVYNSNFERMFTFGTPIAGGGTADFAEPWGLAYWPDANGGRLFVNDTYNSRILVYRPTDTTGSPAGVDSLLLETQIEGFVPAVPKLSLFAIAVEPSSGSIAVTDFADNDDGGHPRTLVLQRPQLAAFNVHALDASNTVINNVCAGANFQVRFSLTVPQGQATVRKVTPRLDINGVPTTVAAVPSGSYTLSAGEVVTFTYALTAPAIRQDISLFANATASNTTDILGRAGFVFVADCAGETAPSIVTATPNIPAQVSGWTAVRPNQSYSVALAASDPDGIDTIEYRLEGANGGAGTIEVDFDGAQTSASATVPLPEFGRSTLYYRVRDGNGIWSPMSTLNVRPTLVVDRVTNENGGAEFRVGDPEGTGIVYSVSGLPPGASFATNTGQFSGVISFDAVDPYSSNPILASGVYPVVVTETAPSGATSSVGFTWTINHVNRAPIITNPPVVAGSLTINQGELFTMQINGMDPDGDPAVFSLYGRGINEGHVLPSTVTIDLVTGLISGVFPVGSDPAYDFSVSLAECGSVTELPPCNVPPLPGARQATFFDFQLEVLDLNEPADIVNPGEQTDGEGDTVALVIQASDPDGDLLTFAASGLPPGLSISSPDGQTALISGTVAWGSAGTYAVTVKADDHMNALQRDVTFSWVITHTNRPPSLTIPNKINFELQAATGSVSATDPDATDTLVYSAVGLPPGASMSSSGVFSGQFDYDSAGDYTVTVTVSDGTTEVVATFLWTVLNVNRPPVLPAEPQFNAEGDSVSVMLAATDPDRDTLTYNALGLPPGLTWNTATGQISGTLTYDSAGVHVVSIGVHDGTTWVLNSFVWTVSDSAPIVGAIADKINSEGDVVSLPPIPVTDLGGDLVFSFSAMNLPPGLTINPLTGAIAGTLSYTAAAVYSVGIKVSDANGAFTVVAFTWTVNNVNRPPTVSAPNRTNAENDTVAYATTAADPDLDTLTYSASGLPAGISINSSTGALTGTLDYTTAGTYTPTITVGDGTVTASAPFVWLVTETNAPPVLTNPGNLVNDEGETISRQIAATDIDGLATLTFTATGLPPGLSISPSGLISGTLSYTSAGVYPLSTITVSDGTNTRTVTFTWTVNNVNLSPDVINPGTLISAEGAVIVKPIIASDPDLQPLAYSAAGLPPGLAIDPATGVISGTIAYTAAPAYTVTVTASDGSLSDSETFIWNITNVNQAPVAQPDSSSVIQGQSVVIDVRANDSDADNDSLTITQIVTPPASATGTAVISGGGTTITFTAAATYIGPATFKYRISDGNGGTADAWVTVTVLTSNQSPVCSAAPGGEIWPPNHKRFYAAPITGVTDPDGDAVTIRIDGVWQDEPLDSTGDGEFSPDARIENGTVWLRAERNGHGNNAPGDGRVYAILFTASDNKGGSCSGSVLWSVPHDQGQRSTAIQGNLQYESTGVILGTRDKTQIHQKSPLP